MYKFGSTSKGRLITCHPDLVNLMRFALTHKDCPCDFSILCGVRGRADQEEAFELGNSLAEFGESPHNFYKSLAVDIGPYVRGIGTPWDDVDLFDKLAAHVKKCAAILGIKITWGGDFKSIIDKPHFELTDWRDMEKELAE